MRRPFALSLVFLSVPGAANEPVATVALSDDEAAGAERWFRNSLLGALVEDRPFNRSAMATPADAWCAAVDEQVALIAAESRPWWNESFRGVLASLNDAERANLLGQRVKEGAVNNPADLRAATGLLARRTLARILPLARELTARIDDKLAAAGTARAPGDVFAADDFSTVWAKRFADGTIFCGLMPKQVNDAIEEGMTE
jgi:hypothetical protein